MSFIAYHLSLLFLSLAALYSIYSILSKRVSSDLKRLNESVGQEIKKSILCFHKETGVPLEKIAEEIVQSARNNDVDIYKAAEDFISVCDRDILPAHVKNMHFNVFFHLRNFRGALEGESINKGINKEAQLFVNSLKELQQKYLECRIDDIPLNDQDIDDVSAKVQEAIDFRKSNSYDDAARCARELNDSISHLLSKLPL